VLPVVTYFLARLVLFAVAVVVLGLLGAGPVLALFGGLLISVLLSYLLLSRLREPATAVVAQRMRARQERRTAHHDEDELFEDAAVDSQARGRTDTDRDTEADGEVDSVDRERTDRSFPSEALRDGERQA
jgi:uncharacterized protein DUF4229